MADSGTADNNVARRLKSLSWGAGIGLAAAVRYFVFLLLLWVRGPLRFTLMLIAMSALLALLLLWYGLPATDPRKAVLMLAIAAAGFAAFSTVYFYDELLLRLAPRPIRLS
jgi:TRAP-type uncharacterized transport system fused permease subunit